jgi:hypothetical protein
MRPVIPVTTREFGLTDPDIRTVNYSHAFYITGTVGYDTIKGVQLFNVYLAFIEIIQA